MIVRCSKKYLSLKLSVICRRFRHMFALQGREEALVSSQIEEEQRVAELRRAQAALQEKQEKNDKKKENEEFLDSLVMLINSVFVVFVVLN